MLHASFFSFALAVKDFSFVTGLLSMSVRGLAAFYWNSCKGNAVEIPGPFASTVA